MTDEEFRESLLASVAARAESQSCGSREAFVAEWLERLRESGEAPDAEPCAETLEGPRHRRLEIDAWADDEADDSLHLFVALHDGRAESPPNIGLAEARDQGLRRLLNVFNTAREGGSPPTSRRAGRLGLGPRIAAEPLPSALRLHVLTDRRQRADQGNFRHPHRRGRARQHSRSGRPRLKRIHEAANVRDDLVVDFSTLPGGGLRSSRHRPVAVPTVATSLSSTARRWPLFTCATAAGCSRATSGRSSAVAARSTPASRRPWSGTRRNSSPTTTGSPPPRLCWTSLRTPAGHGGQRLRSSTAPRPPPRSPPHCASVDFRPARSSSR